MTISTFKGTSNLYQVVAVSQDVHWGVCITLTPQMDFLVRFACLGLTSAPPKHLNFRMAGEFDAGEGATPGIYFDRKVFPVVAKSVPIHMFANICEAMDIPAILGEWVARQFEKEGVKVDPLQVEGLFLAAYAPQEVNLAVSCFQMPKDLFHEPLVTDHKHNKGA